MKTALFVSGLIVLMGCASQDPRTVVAPAMVDHRTAVIISPKTDMVDGIPIKSMTPSQSAARMN